MTKSLSERFWKSSVQSSCQSWFFPYLSIPDLSIPFHTFPILSNVLSTSNCAKPVFPTGSHAIPGRLARAPRRQFPSLWCSSTDNRPCLGMIGNRDAQEQHITWSDSEKEPRGHVRHRHGIWAIGCNLWWISCMYIIIYIYTNHIMFVCEVKFAVKKKTISQFGP